MTKSERFANIILGGSGLLCTLGLGYVIYSYDWNGTRHFSSPVGAVLYHVLPAATAGLLFAAVRLRAPRKVNLALLFLSTTLSLYVLEALLSTTTVAIPEPIPVREAAARKAGIKFDTRSKLEVINDLRKEGIGAYPVITSRYLLVPQPDGRLKSRIVIGGDEALPLAGIANKVSVFCNEGGDWVTYESDEHGFHNPKGIWNLGRVDVASLGDSYAEGWCVPSDKNSVALIRKRFPATLNLAKAANGPLLELAGLEEYGPIVRPRVVLWFFFEGNNLCNLRIEKHSPLLMRYVVGNFTQGLLDKQAEVDRTLRAYVEAAIDAENSRRASDAAKNARGSIGAAGNMGRVVGLLTMRHLRQRLGLINDGDQEVLEPFAKRYGCVVVNGAHYLDVFREEEVDLFRTVMLQAKTLASTWGGRLYFVYLPEWQRYTNPALANKDRERVLTLVRTVGIPIIDIQQAFQAHSDPLALFPFRLQGHYNEEGHRVVAETVLQSLSLGN